MCSAAPRYRHLKYLLPRILCCFLYSCASGYEDGSEEGGTPMGPMTLREYVNTLEPYNPWVHGWRGEEPRRVWQPEISPPTPMPVEKNTKRGKSSKNRRHAHK